MTKKARRLEDMTLEEVTKQVYPPFARTVLEALKKEALNQIDGEKAPVEKEAWRHIAEALEEGRFVEVVLHLKRRVEEFHENDEEIVGDVWKF